MKSAIRREAGIYLIAGGMRLLYTTPPYLVNSLSLQLSIKLSRLIRSTALPVAFGN